MLENNIIHILYSHKYLRMLGWLQHITVSITIIIIIITITNILMWWYDDDDDDVFVVVVIFVVAAAAAAAVVVVVTIPFIIDQVPNSMGQHSSS